MLRIRSGAKTFSFSEAEGDQGTNSEDEAAVEVVGLGGDARETVGRAGTGSEGD
jgi:hypothetical protein